MALMMRMINIINNTKKIEEKLYKMWLFKEQLKEHKESPLYAIRDARLNGAIDLLKTMGYKVIFDPLAENLNNPFIVRE